MGRATIALLIAFSVLPVTPAAAQTSDPPPRFEAIGQLTGAMSSQFDGTDLGVGGLFAWHPETIMAVEAETNFYPEHLTMHGGPPYSRGTVEALFGISAGPVLGSVRPFGAFRTGVVMIRSAPGPLACPAIFPPLLSCVLARGEAVVATDVGGGMELYLTPRAVVRFELGDRLMHYPGAAIDAQGEIHNMAFYKNEFRFAVGAGVRF